MLKVLIIDDDDIVLFIQRKMLQKSGITDSPKLYSVGQEALDFLTQEEPGDHYLILLDINMPGISGWEFLETLKTLPILPYVHVLMVTSSIDSFDKEKAKAYDNVFDFIEKPITIENCYKVKNHPELKQFFQ